MNRYDIMRLSTGDRLPMALLAYPIWEGVTGMQATKSPAVSSARQ